MFEPPVYTPNQFGARASAQVVKSRFVFAELDEIQSRKDSRTDPAFHDSRLVATLPYHEHASKSKKRKREDSSNSYIEEGHKGKELEYRGLFSTAIYDQEGEIVQERVQKQVEKNSTATPQKKRHYRKEIATPYDLQINGFESLPRPVTPLKVIRDSPQTVQADLSERAKRIVAKNNHPTQSNRSVTQKSVYDTVLGETKSLSILDNGTTVHHEDSWLYRSLKLRHSHIVSSLLHIAMLRKDYALASRAFALLIRARNVDIRVVWTIGLELLVWRRETRELEEENQERNNRESSGEPHHSFKESSSSGISSSLPNNNDIHTRPHRPNDRLIDERFLNWLIINYPHISNLHNSSRFLWKRRDRAPQIYPHMVLSKLRLSNPKAALDKMEEIMLQSPYSDEPIYYAYCGIAVIQLMVQEPEESQSRYLLAERARQYFDTCIAKGGVLPKEFIDFEMNSMVKPVHDGDEDEDEGGNVSSSDEEGYDNETKDE